jgi:signal transduction histidine kinase
VDVPLHGGPVRTYGIRNGLPTNAFLRARWATPGGRIFFGTGEGFITFHPDSLNKNPYPPRVVLTAFSIFDEPFMSRQPIWSVAAMRLSYDQDFFSFRFAALDYTDPSSNSFLYRLDGFEEEWNRAGTRTFASYTGVDPGDYTFRVRAANSDGVWDEAGLSVGLHIDPPYWRTWWFRSLVIIALAGLAAAAYRYRVAKLLEMERMRVRIASDLHDDIGSSLSGIALVTESLKNRGGLEDGDRQHLADVSRTARRTADALRDIVWLVNPQHDTVNDLFLRMKDAASMVLTGTEYSISTSGESATRTMSLDFRHQLILIYKEILNNIAKHARARHVSISISLSEDGFMLRIEDDGVGFDPTVRRSGNGLVNLQRRGAAIKGKLSLESTPGRGTVVTLTAPLG